MGSAATPLADALPARGISHQESALHPPGKPERARWTAFATSTSPDSAPLRRAALIEKSRLRIAECPTGGKPGGRFSGTPHSPRS